MRRYFSLALEGSIIGAILGFFASFVSRNLPITMAVGVLLGVVVRISIDYIWEIYNKATGKSLD